MKRVEDKNILSHDGPIIKTRRQFIGLSAGLGAACAGGADIAYALRPNITAYKLSDDDISVLDERAKSITPYISSGDFSVISNGCQEYKPLLNKDAVTKTITGLAYLDKGKESIDNVISSLTESGIKFSLRNSSERDEIGGTFLVPRNTNQPLEIDISRWVLEDHLSGKNTDYIDEIFFHELYHFIQYSRDPNFYRQYRNAKIVFYFVAAPLVMAASTKVMTADIVDFTNKTVDKFFHTSLTRRQFLRRLPILAGALAAPAAIPAARTVGKLLEPFELQAYLQTSQNLKHPYFQKLQGKFLNFEKMS